MSDARRARRAQERAERRTHSRGPLTVSATYSRTPVGQWTGYLESDEHGDTTYVLELEPQDSAAAIFAVAMEAVGDLGELVDRDIATVHTLDGDPAAWMLLAIREGITG